mmetsp:Transcript_94120/g.218741  ORF Transcript_94120/g.218741 Transcript_94120/m.218741 type:complete len:93 (-) Transcript_94120:302-580(-)
MAGNEAAGIVKGSSEPLNNGVGVELHAKPLAQTEAKKVAVAGAEEVGTGGGPDGPDGTLAMAITPFGGGTWRAERRPLFPPSAGCSWWRKLR